MIRSPRTGAFCENQSAAEIRNPKVEGRKKSEPRTRPQAGHFSDSALAYFGFRISAVASSTARRGVTCTCVASLFGACWRNLPPLAICAEAKRKLIFKYEHEWTGSSGRR